MSKVKTLSNQVFARFGLSQSVLFQIFESLTDLQVLFHADGAQLVEDAFDDHVERLLHCGHVFRENQLTDSKVFAAHHVAGFADVLLVVLDLFATKSKPSWSIYC